MVSVIMPVYNGEKYLREAIDSILNQTLQDFELVIVDDGSTDGTEAIVGSYNSDKIRYHANEKNLGHAASCNRLLDLAHGEFVAQADADDLSHPQRLERQTAFMRDNPQVGVVGARICRFKGAPPPFGAKAKAGGKNTGGLFQFGPVVHHPVVMFRKSIITTNEIRFNQKFSHASDFDFFLRLGLVTKIVEMGDTLLLYRRHGKNHSSNEANLVEARDIFCDFMKNNFDADFFDIFDESQRIKSIEVFTKLEHETKKALAAMASDSRLDISVQRASAIKFLYQRLRRFGLRTGNWRAVLSAYRQSNLLRDLEFENKRRLYIKARLQLFLPALMLTTKRTDKQ